MKGLSSAAVSALFKIYAMTLCLCLCLCLTGGVFAQPLDLPADQEDMPWFRNLADSEKYALILTGAAASPEIRERFRDWSVSLFDILETEYGYDRGHITLLLDDGENIGQAGERVSGSSRLEDMYHAFEELAARTEAGDQITVFLIGHGSNTFGEAKFNNVGPDITGEEFARILEEFPGRDIVVINSTSASYEFSQALAAPGRIIVSATRSRAERYDPMFMRYFLEGLQERRADMDRNGRVSLLESFNYASRNVAAWYSDQGRLATEHAVIDDTGDGVFTREPGEGASGMLAEIAYFDILAVEEQKTSPEARQLLARMQDLERAVFILRGQKENYLENDYWNRLQILLVDLATATRRYNELP